MSMLASPSPPPAENGIMSTPSPIQRTHSNGRRLSGALHGVNRSGPLSSSDSPVPFKAGRRTSSLMAMAASGEGTEGEIDANFMGKRQARMGVIAMPFKTCVQLVMETMGPANDRRLSTAMADAGLPEVPVDATEAEHIEHLQNCLTWVLEGHADYRGSVLKVCDESEHEVTESRKLMWTKAGEANRSDANLSKALSDLNLERQKQLRYASEVEAKMTAHKNKVALLEKLTTDLQIKNQKLENQVLTAKRTEQLLAGQMFQMERSHSQGSGMNRRTPSGMIRGEHSVISVPSIAANDAEGEYALEDALSERTDPDSNAQDGVHGIVHVAVVEPVIEPVKPVEPMPVVAPPAPPAKKKSLFKRFLKALKA